MKVSPDGDVLDAENELEDVGDEIAELEEQLARKRSRYSQLHGEKQMSPEEKAKAIRRTMTKCAKALSNGDISLETFASVAAMARGIKRPAGGTFGKSMGSHAHMPINQRATVGNLHANGLGHLVGPAGDWR